MCTVILYPSAEAIHGIAVQLLGNHMAVSSPALPMSTARTPSANLTIRPLVFISPFCSFVDAFHSVYC